MNFTQAKQDLFIFLILCSGTMMGIFATVGLITLIGGDGFVCKPL